MMDGLNNQKNDVSTEEAPTSVRGQELNDAALTSGVAETEPQSSVSVEGDVLEASAGEGGVPNRKRTLKLALPKFKKSPQGEIQARTVTRPIRLIIGFLPEVSKRDAIEFAQGIASKYFDQQGLAYYGAFEHENGFVYEVQEGGEGLAYSPAIIEHFSTLGPFDTQRVDSVVIATATRMAQVQRQRGGLTCILLPQQSSAEPTEWLLPTTPLEPALNRRQLFFKVGGFMLASGLAAMVITGLFFRLQDFDPPPEMKTEAVSAAVLPRSQWARIVSLPPNTYVKALRFKNGKWEAPEVAVEAATSPASSTSSASSGSATPATH